MKGKKISYEEAKKFITSGIPVEALVSRDMIPVTTLNDLENLNHLKLEKVQNFELFYEPVTIPDTAIEASIDDAINLVDDGETICSMHQGEELKFSSSSELINYYRSCMMHEKSCYLYWYVN